ncbi:hypothetical protein KEM09_00565 [Carboxylicivirga mesophila]|uniref:EF-hand domain-containing protein n=1 Tax=Carboxylicivirga mesophila TaxID=1166478 RepID=A0ABS5K4C0_9BACT|nr:hypothetical protein [Carboxylicivirga mesophila]MBS2209876.1 hypothetical protein [Carboxylicivirga mesophila]
MNIEKVKNYNARMLAVLSTILVLLGVIAIVTIASVFISDLLPRQRVDNNTLVADDKAEQLVANNLRKHLVSFDAPHLVDTAALLYIIPVKTKQLSRPEDIGEGVMNMYEEEGSFRSSKWGKRTYYYDAFNNLLVYDGQADTTHKILDERVVGTDLTYNYMEKDVLLIFNIVDSDTNNDGEISEEDLSTLHIYSVGNQKLMPLPVSSTTVLNYERVPDKHQLMVTLGVDRNNDGRFDYKNEPTTIVCFDWEHNRVNTIISEELKSELQQIIDRASN